MPARFLSLILLLLALCPARAQLVPPDTTEGKTSLQYEDEPFANYSAADGGAGFVKFAIILSDPGTVYFQDSNLYPFHYEFATQRLQPFLGMSRTKFDAVSLRREGQQVVLGAIIFPPYGGPREFGVQFVGLDSFPRQDVKSWFETVRASVTGNAPVAAIYIPSFEQKAAAETDRAWFEEQGIEVDAIERWITSTAVYADGWAFGRLVFVPGDQIAAAYAAGTLRATDVLLTDGVPAEVPFVAGILTLSAATPNSHVAILARNQRIPFGWIASAAEQERITALIGREVLVRTARESAGPLRVSAADENLSPKLRAAILAHKQPPVVQVKRRKHLGQLSRDAALLVPEDIRFFGGKASNFGLLRRTIPGNSPRAIAFSFDLWEQFLGNVNPDSGLTLREEIDSRLAGFTWPPPMPEASTALAEVREVIRKKVKFTDGQKDALLVELLGAGFSPTRMLRFRSSSNAEDTAQFSGAGLYESFSGCIADSQDGDNQGPCGCAADEPEEKTVLKAIEKVFASFYNDNAWLERLRYGIREKHVGMALLVHENAPDADELANGVVTLKQRPGFEPGQPQFEFEIVTQLGAMSVTNPEGGAKAEVVLGGQSGFKGNTYVYTQQHSDVVPLGANVMTWESDYRDLVGMLVKVAQGYGQLFPLKKTFTLDFEFKRLKPGVLQVRQARELFVPPKQMVEPILLNEPTELVVLQTEFSDAFAHHRLKSVLAVETRNVVLSSEAGTRSVYRRSTFDHLVGSARARLENGPLGWPLYRFRSSTVGNLNDIWRVGSGETRATFRLRSSVPLQVDAAVSPVITQQDFGRQLTAIYKTPQPYLTFRQKLKQRSSDTATLVPRDSLVPDEAVQSRRIEAPGGISIAPVFHWPRYTGFVIIKTYPLARWERTTIAGLTTTPLVLTDEFAQTYAPGHHNFSEDFLFEPALDPGVTESQRAELRNANIRLIHVYHDRALGGSDAVHVIDFDDALRKLD